VLCLAFLCASCIPLFISWLVDNQLKPCA
jgi:hypothetical protein